ncbi:MAG: hypothetical protein IJL85_06075 [Erysipelotrichaceae bacterium]|nr:hypothetical protein [Erysipelotrichaceae bacterium]
MERAKELFLYYCGNQYFMDLNGDGNEYRGYQISKEKEEEWRKEYLDQFLVQKCYGREALRSYANAVKFLKSKRCDNNGKEYLHYPLRSDWLDDVTILFMLPYSFQLAEKRTEKRSLSKEEIKNYLLVLDGYIEEVQKRVEDGTITRAEDYTLQEFSDPTYVAKYLKDLRQDWNRLTDM